MSDSAEDVFRIEQSGEVMVIRPTQRLESIRWDLLEHAADLVIAPIQHRPAPLVVVALDEVSYFGSAFLSLLLRLWKHVSVTGGMMVISGATPRARELLRVTNLDTLWAIYDTDRDAIAALEAE